MFAKRTTGTNCRVPRMCFEWLWRQNSVFSAHCPPGLHSHRQKVGSHINHCIPSSKFILNSQTVVCMTSGKESYSPNQEIGRKINFGLENYNHV